MQEWHFRAALAQKQLAEILGTMERKPGVDGIPREIMRGGSQVSALVAIAPQRQTWFRLELGEEPTDKGEGNLISDLPTIVCALRLWSKNRILILNDQAYQIRIAGADPQEQCAVWIKLKVKVPGIVRGTEEKLQAAVLADRSHQTGMFGTDIGFPRQQAYIDGGIIPTKLRLRANVGVFCPLRDIDGKDGYGIPIGGAGDFLESVSFHSSILS